MLRTPHPDPNAHALRSAIAGWLVGDARVAPEALVEAHGIEAVLGAIEHEGVVSLVHARFADPALGWAVPTALAVPLAARARASAARGLLCLSEARRIQQVLDQASIPALWMKGIALGRWLYPQPHLRDIADIDLLLPDHATTMRAADVLAPLGYVLPNPHIAGDLVVHELLAYSARARLELDLHWDVSNAALFAGLLPWSTLQAEAIELPGLGARGLSPVHGFLHASLHLAGNGLVWREPRLRWLYDIHLLAQEFEADGWAHVLGAAREMQLADASVFALQECRTVFATQVADSVMADFEAAAALEPVRSARLRHWGYFQWACWQRLPTLRARVAWLRQLLFPDMAHLRVRYGADGAGALRVSVRRVMDGARRWWDYAQRARADG